MQDILKNRSQIGLLSSYIHFLLNIKEPQACRGSFLQRNNAKKHYLLFIK